MSKSKKRQKKLTPSKVRNRFAFDPIMKKGGVHEKTTKAKRNHTKMEMKRELKMLPFDFPETTFLISLLTATRFTSIVPFMQWSSPMQQTVTS